jgi:hypothetical protein
MREPFEDAVAIYRASIEHFESLIAAGDTEATRLTIKRIVGAIAQQGRRRDRGNPGRGLGYGTYDKDGNLTKDDAQIVASMPEHKNSLTKAIRAHYPEADSEEVRRHAKRIREHMKAIEAAGVPDYT